MQSNSRESCAFIFSKRPNLSIKSFDVKFNLSRRRCSSTKKIQIEYHGAKKKIPTREYTVNIIGAYVLANHFDIELQAISQKEQNTYSYIHTHTHIHLMDYQFPFIHSFMRSQTMNLMSRFNHERKNETEDRRKTDKERERRKKTANRIKRRHFSFHLSLSSHLKYLFGVFVHCAQRAHQNTAENCSARRNIFSETFFLVAFFCSLSLARSSVHVCLIDTYKLKTERASMLKSKHE